MMDHLGYYQRRMTFYIVASTGASIDTAKSTSGFFLWLVMDVICGANVSIGKMPTLTLVSLW